ncbi:hypothetical protein KO494_08205 [Lacinutrix sp. C3R15]|nr:hypothetical protein [Lacinutrix sp. C3R15]
MKKITEVNSLLETETYYVLKANKDLKHGTYTKVGYYPKTVISTGEYAYGKKKGVWVYYHAGCSIVKSKGSYENNKKVGEWFFYDNTGKQNQLYNYTTKDLIWSKENNQVQEVFVGGVLKSIPLEKSASIIGGVFNFELKLSTDFHAFYKAYHKKEKPLNLSLVDISILIKKDGTVGEIKYNKPISNEVMIAYITKEIDARKGKWLVAEYHGKKVAAYLNVRFGVSIKKYEN